MSDAHAREKEVADLLDGFNPQDQFDLQREAAIGAIADRVQMLHTLAARARKLVGERAQHASAMPAQSQRYMGKVGNVLDRLELPFADACDAAAAELMELIIEIGQEKQP